VHGHIARAESGVGLASSGIKFRNIDELVGNPCNRTVSVDDREPMVDGRHVANATNIQLTITGVPWSMASRLARENTDGLRLPIG